MRMMETRWLSAVLALFLVWPGGALAQSTVPADLEAAILLRALAYDRNLKQWAGDRVRIAVIARGGEASSDQIAGAFREAGKNGVGGLPVEATVVAFESAAQLGGALDSRGFNVFYIHPSVEDALTQIQQVAQRRKIPSFGGNRAIVEKGASVGVYVDGNYPKLVVNIAASRVEGLDFPAELLGISTVIN